MADMKLDVTEFVNRVRARFPREAALTDVWLAERGWEPQESPHIWVEAFADRTTDAVRAENWDLVEAHTGFIAELLRHGSDAVEKLVDVSYAENLMWDLAQPEKVQAWPHINAAIRQLYEQMWGAPGE